MVRLINIISFLFLSFFLSLVFSVKADAKNKIGLLVPMSGPNKEIGESIIKAVRLALKDIDDDMIEIYPKDTASRPNQTLKSAFELKEMDRIATS